jgi:hypothetical protein
MPVPPFGHARRRSHLRPRDVTPTAREGAGTSPPRPRGGRRPRCLSLDGDRRKQTVPRHLERCEAGTQGRVLRGRACASRVAHLTSACWMLGSPTRAYVRTRPVAPTPAADPGTWTGGSSTVLRARARFCWPSRSVPSSAACCCWSGHENPSGRNRWSGRVVAVTGHRDSCCGERGRARRLWTMG